MSEYVGRTGGRRNYSYPETGRGSGPGGLFARNYAFGPATALNIGGPVTGTEIPWGSVDAPGVATEDVPITPVSTGVITVKGVVSLHNTDEADAVDVRVQVMIGPTGPAPIVYAVPASEKVSVPFDDGEGGEGFAVLPFFVQIPALPIGIEQTVRILLTADAENLVQAVANSSTVEVQEVAVSTG